VHLFSIEQLLLVDGLAIPDFRKVRDVAKRRYHLMPAARMKRL
jgi:hypothetical protein